MSGICDTCKRNQDCRKPMNGMESCRLYISDTTEVGSEVGSEVGTRWHELFGTPERAARMLQPDTMRCEYCLLREHCKDGICLIEDYDALLEWLNQEMDA